MSRVTDMKGMFARAALFNGDLSKWDVSRVANMKDVFTSALAFNTGLSEWDVSCVECAGDE